MTTDTINRQDILDRFNARCDRGEVSLMGTHGPGVLVSRLGGARLDFPSLFVGSLSCEISWHLAERVANGTTSQILG